jgi:F-type H+-transporting ATPase subunit gamma
VNETEPYSAKALNLLLHLADQPGHNSLHPLLKERSALDKVLVVMISSDRGLAGAYNVNIVRQTLSHFRTYDVPVTYITVGRKGREMMWRRGQDIMAEFSNIPTPTTFMDVSAIGRLAVDDYLEDKVDRVYIAYTRFENMIRQVPVIQKLLPMDVELEPGETRDGQGGQGPQPVYIYEPGQTEILEEIVPRFTALQIYQAILFAQASEHAARMVAMRNASDNAQELIAGLQLEYNKVRQRIITSDMLDIAGGVEAQAASSR